MQGKPTEGGVSTTASKSYGELTTADIVPGTELVDLDSDQASDDDNESESEYTHTQLFLSTLLIKSSLTCHNQNNLH